MNSKSNLQNALKNAFENHEVPLRESQWHRLEGVLVNTKPKWRIFPFIFTFLLIGITSIATYFLTLKFSLEPKQVGIEVTLPLKTNIKNETSTSLKNNTNNKKQNNRINFKTIASHSLLNVDKKVKIKSGIKNIPSTPEETKKSILIAENTKTLEDEDIASAENEINNLKQSNNDIFETEDVIEPLNIKPEITNPDGDPRDKEKGTKHPKPSRMAVSASAGYSKMNIKIKDIENENKLHKDTRSLFDQCNKNSKTFFFNLGFDYSLMPGLNVGLNTGVQYLRITNPVNINYRITEVPFSNIDGTIFGYYTADSANAVELSTTATNTTNYINIPLRFNYTIPINFKNEILLTAGANLMAIVGANGKDIAINESQVKPLNKNVYNQFSAGFLGGIQYSHQLKDPWWLGVETQWSSNKMSFKSGPGTLNTQLNGYRLNLILKYKI
jgi:hypothetical protein